MQETSKGYWGYFINEWRAFYDFQVENGGIPILAFICCAFGVLILLNDAHERMVQDRRLNSYRQR